MAAEFPVGGAGRCGRYGPSGGEASATPAPPRLARSTPSPSRLSPLHFHLEHTARRGAAWRSAGCLCGPLCGPAAGFGCSSTASCAGSSPCPSRGLHSRSSSARSLRGPAGPTPRGARGALSARSEEGVANKQRQGSPAPARGPSRAPCYHYSCLHAARRRGSCRRPCLGKACGSAFCKPWAG